MRYGQYKDESSTYRRAREELLEAELALRNQREMVAAMRRALPLDVQVEDYVFHEGASSLAENDAARAVLVGILQRF